MGIYIDGIDLPKSTYIELRIEPGGNIARPFGHGYIIDPDAVAVEVNEKSECITRTEARREIINMLRDCFDNAEEVVDAVTTTLDSLPAVAPKQICIAKVNIPEEKLKQVIDNAVGQLAETIGAEYKELVHCKDCKYRDPQTCATSTMWLPCMEVRTDDDWFCADGDR